jgi:hypothetical protein
MMSMLCNCCVHELLILARTWFAFGLPSKTGCNTDDPCIECSYDTIGWQGDLAKVASSRSLPELGLGRFKGAPVA